MLLEYLTSYYGILLIVVGVIFFIIGIIINRTSVGFIGVVVIASNMNIPGIHTYMQDLLGFGFTIPVFIIIIVFLIVLNGVDVIKFPKHIFGNYGLLLLTLLYIVFFSVFNSKDISETTSYIMFLFLVILCGWFLIGKYASTNTNPRDVTFLIIDTIGFVSLFTVIVLMITVGPIALKGLIGTTQNQITIFGITVTQLTYQGFNATGVGVTASTAVFWLYAIFQRTNSVSIKMLTIPFMVASMVALLWTGSRGSISAFMLTTCIIYVISHGRKILSLRGFTLGFIVSVFIGTIMWPTFIDILTRKSPQYDGNIDIASLYIDERIELQGPQAREYLLNPTVFGRGYGALSAGGDSRNEINLESYWLKALVELGIIGSIIHIIVFATLSLIVIRVDLMSSRFGERGAFLPSSIIIFVWANSISSWGFILPYGTLIIHLGIMSSSLITLNKYRKTQVTYTQSFSNS